MHVPTPYGWATGFIGEKTPQISSVHCISVLMRYVFAESIWVFFSTFNQPLRWMIRSVCSIKRLPKLVVARLILHESHHFYLVVTKNNQGSPEPHRTRLSHASVANMVWTHHRSPVQIVCRRCWKLINVSWHFPWFTRNQKQLVKQAVSMLQQILNACLI